MKRTAGVLEDGFRILNSIADVETCLCEELGAVQGSKFDMHSRMIYFRKKLMENECLGKMPLRRKSSRYHG